MNTIGDFHVHTNFCPHGSNDSMESYVVAAINKGLKSITFTEHAPLPKTFIDPTPNRDSAMLWEDVDKYLNEANELKEKYKNTLNIKIGFEIDFISGYEESTKELLNHFGPHIDDAILSVHMLQAPNGEYVCIDYSVEEFERIIQQFGTIDNVYKTYYKTIKQAILSDLGKYKPIRIGHLTLIEKFSKVFRAKEDYLQEINGLLDLINEKQYELDANTAGYYKEYCNNCYPSLDIMRIASDKGIRLIPGSDSHASKHIGRGFEQIPDDITLSSPGTM
ncbi:histidinol-phosphatase HisJ [Aquibacillus rhizosphaerae]|uniref:Histidinol-phosphatase n=1 Tax=Aquibacillus rhizosphaerae TaxID=3051431 RepID=A0ABT7L135_9BACI|nr:histidinol-phosphatase HisJ [Aquibacillus sp. LR5S19]MDL4839562.1 histidinol-phosphatase HisJ [Aquibacillus sp. LR5S19]